MEHEAGMSSFETEDLLQQMELQQLQREIENPQGFTSSLESILTMVTFVVVTGLACCLRWKFNQMLLRPSAPIMDLPMIASAPPMVAPVAPLQFVRRP